MKISLRAARVNAGFTQKEVCKLLECSQATIQKWENGSSKPKRLFLNALSELYSIPVDELDLPENPPKP